MGYPVVFVVAKDISEVEDNLEAQQQECYSLAFNESTDRKNIAQPTILIREFDSDITVYEDLGVVSLKDRTRG